MKEPEKAITSPATPKRPSKWRRRGAIAVGVVLGLACWLWTAQHIELDTETRPPATDVAAEAQLLLDRFSEKAAFRGCVLIAEGGEVVVEASYGDGIDADSRFSIGSVSKTITGFVVMDLVEAGKLALDDPVSRHVPELADHAVGPATIDQVLHMQSGLRAYWDLTFALGVQLDEEPISAKDLLAEVAGYALLAPPGTEHHYSNLGYVLLTIIAERVTEQTWGELVHDHVLGPAAMNDSGVFGHHDASAVVDGHLPLQPLGVGPVVALELPRWNYSMIEGAAAVFTTARDLLRWDRFLVDVARERPDFYERLVEPVQGYAMGWGNRRAQRCSGHRAWRRGSGILRTPRQTPEERHHRHRREQHAIHDQQQLLARREPRAPRPPRALPRGPRLTRGETLFRPAGLARASRSLVASSCEVCRRRPSAPRARR